MAQLFTMVVQGLIVWNDFDLDPLDLLNSVSLGCYQGMK